MSPAPIQRHGTALAVATSPEAPLCGVLLTGASGSGKTSLALSLIESCREGRSRLIADDVVRLGIDDDRITAAPVGGGRGLVEIAGTGLARVEALASYPLTAVFDITGDDGDRLPFAAEFKPFGEVGPALPLFAWRRRRGAAGFLTFLRSILAGHGVLCGHDTVRSPGNGS